MPCLVCTDCSLSKAPYSHFYAPALSGAKIMIIADKPYDQEVIGDKVFSTKALSLVDVVFKKGMGIQEQVFHPSYLVKCPTERDVTYEMSVPCSHTKLIAEILEVKPTVIVTLGEEVTKMFLGAESFKETVGRVHKREISGLQFSVVPNYSAGYARHNDGILKLFAKNLELSYNLAYEVKAAQVPVQLEYVHDLATFESVVTRIEQAKVCCFDFETTDIEKHPLYSEGFKTTCLAISYQLGHSAVIPLFHDENTYFTPEQVMYMLNTLGARVFGNRAVTKIAHNTKFDRHVLNIYGIPFVGQMNDTMLMHHLLDETTTHGLKDLVDRYIPEFSGYEDEVKKYKWEAVPLPILEKYAGADTYFELIFFYKFKAMLLQDETLYRIYRNEVLPAANVLWHAEAHGMLVDKEKAFEYEADLLSKIEETDEAMHKIKKVKEYIGHVREEERISEVKKLEDKIVQLQAKGDKRSQTAIEKTRAALLDIQAGRGDFYDRVNWGSWQQLDKLLYTDKGFNLKKPFSKGKSGSATGKDILKDLKDKSGLIDLLLRYRGLSKLCSTYIVGIRNVCDAFNRVHTSFLLHGTKSGRLSSKSPNMQNIPAESKTQDPVMRQVAPYVKQMFVAPAGYTILQVDFSQAELRIAAEFADETVMIQAYADNKDLHTVTAMSAGRLSQEQWDALTADDKKVNRSKAKAGNFGLIYEISVEGFMDFAKNTYGVIYSFQEAEEYVYRFFKTYPALKNWHEMSKAIGRKYGYVTTLFGRRRHTPDINHEVSFKRGEDERVAINSPVQGTAGELTIFALILLHSRLDPRCILVNTVHDSIIYYIPDWLVDASAVIIKDTCENLPTQQYFRNSLKKVKMKVDIETSKKSWKDLKPWEPAKELV